MRTQSPMQLYAYDSNNNIWDQLFNDHIVPYTWTTPRHLSLPAFPQYTVLTAWPCFADDFCRYPSTVVSQSNGALRRLPWILNRCPPPKVCPLSVTHSRWLLQVVPKISISSSIEGTKSWEKFSKAMSDLLQLFLFRIPSIWEPFSQKRVSFYCCETI